MPDGTELTATEDRACAPGFQRVPLGFQLGLHLGDASLDGIMKNLGAPVSLCFQLHAEALSACTLAALHLSCSSSRLRLSLCVPVYGMSQASLHIAR